MSKPRIIKDFENLRSEIQDQIKLFYPNGFEKKLIIYKNSKGQFVSALPFETEDYMYLVRMTKVEAKEIIQEDDDYDEDGILKVEVLDKLTEKYDDSE